TVEFKGGHLFLSITREERGHHRARDQRRPPGLHVKPSPLDPRALTAPPTPWCEGMVPGSVAGLSEASDEVNRARSPPPSAFITQPPPSPQAAIAMSTKLGLGMWPSDENQPAQWDPHMKRKAPQHRNKQSDSEFNSTNKNHMSVFPPFHHPLFHEKHFFFFSLFRPQPQPSHPRNKPAKGGRE
ncbi:hypothetical protein KUCAC02_016367, partial [Chaenocephalus aceratus]